MAVTLPPNFNFPGVQQGIPQGVFQLVQSMSGMSGGANTLGGGLNNSIAQLMQPTAPPINSGPLPNMPAMPAIAKPPVIPGAAAKPAVAKPAEAKTGEFTLSPNGNLIRPGAAQSNAGVRVTEVSPEAFAKMSPAVQQQFISRANDKAATHRANR